MNRRAFTRCVEAGAFLTAATFAGILAFIIWDQDRHR